MSDDDERTDPNVHLPGDKPTGQFQIRQSKLPPSIGGAAQYPPPPMRPSSAPPRPPALPSSRLPASRPLSVPPSAMPRPSDPPPARSEPGPVQRQQMAQLESQLERARATIAQQKEAIDALRARADASEARLAELAEALRDQARLTAVEQRVEAMETRGAELAAKLAASAEAELAPRVDGIDARLRTLEEGTGEARIRMRLERAGHRIEELERKLAAMEEAQRSTSESAAKSAALEAEHATRLARIESLFDELADEVKAERDAHDLDGLRARLDDLESLVTRTGTMEQALERKLSEQERALVTLRESMVPPAAPRAAGDDLTRIKGIGPKYARMLAEMGITTFAQVAGWSDEELEHVAEQLGIPPARIKKAGWIENAAKLAD